MSARAIPAPNRPLVGIATIDDAHGGGVWHHRLIENAQTYADLLREAPGSVTAPVWRPNADEFVAIKDEQLLKHVWVYVSAADERAHKLRLQSLTVHDVNVIYGNGGCLFPYMKSCADWEKLDDFRIKFLVKKSYTHCRERR